MSDLISRSELLKRFYVNKDGHRIPERDCDNFEVTVSIKDVKTIIKEQPTAYDIDKVVEELEKNASRYTKKYLTPYGNNGYRDTKAISIHKAIEIVKQGSVSDDVCEYKIKDKVIYASCNNKQIASAFCWFNECGDYKYCPYCGKKIKIEGDEVDE